MIEQNLEDTRCEFCGTEVTDEYIELNNQYSGLPCDCSSILEII